MMAFRTKIYIPSFYHARGVVRMVNYFDKSANKVKVSAADTESRDRPFTLPPGEFRPKQSLGQNFLSDQNYVNKIVNALVDDSPEGKRVIELGPGAGALSRVLFAKYPKMTAIEIDQRAVAFLQDKLSGLHVVHQDVLQVNWSQLASTLGGRVSVIGNLPYYITSQILFCLADSHTAVKQAVVTMQLEVAERVVAKPRTKAYGILSVVFQLYTTPSLNFKIPPSVFFPQPKVDSALVTLDFTKPHPALSSVKPLHLRRVLLAAFQKRRKMLRQSLKDLLLTEHLTLPDHWTTLRPEDLTPSDFLKLTADLFGTQPLSPSSTSTSTLRSSTSVKLSSLSRIKRLNNENNIESNVLKEIENEREEENEMEERQREIEEKEREKYVTEIVWRKALHKQIDIGTSVSGKRKKNDKGTE
eukprot:CAMPEP_0182425906 /NCGR_PEP_ID=MMETSP1167-20130531/12397_1 /TAXON_ID=2988 /ORGANISM="Mallomonas Sp, Strain CCMP3275" /LENGTH=413 /DNA_ID=CAMNT_0024606977 /DNA_START=262 /DNA_END=1503 /DNA_ORIENTATION=+